MNTYQPESHTTHKSHVYQMSRGVLPDCVGAEIFPKASSVKGQATMSEIDTVI